jgi:cell division protein FtsQ
MDRSFAARSPAGRRHADSSAAAPRALRARGGRIAGGARRRLEGALRAISARRRLRIAAICLVIALPVLGGGWLWLRHSSLVAVQHVTITGVHGPETHAIDAALRDAARGMSTLDAKPAALQAAVWRYPAVSAIRVIPSFPHSMRIVVTQQPAVAALLVAGVRTAVSSDGLVLGPSLLSPSLPTVADDVAPGTGSRVRNVLVVEALAVLGAAPPTLDHLAEKAYFGPRGLTLAMRNGLLVYFGDATRPHAKWLSLASVLADKSSAGATYVDVRLPGRPAAGFPAGAAPTHPEESSGAEPQQFKPESTVSALAAGLEAANPKAKARESEEPTTPAAKEAEGSSTGHTSEGAAEGGASGTEAGEGATEAAG